MRPARRQALKFFAGLAASFAIPSFAYAHRFARDEAGCLVVPVRVNGHGPYPFILDTGSNRTVVTPELVSALGLVVSNGAQNVTGVGGEANAGLVRLARVDVGAFSHDGVTAIVLPSDGVRGAFGAARGAIGMDGLSDKRLLIDFENGGFEVGPGGAAASEDFDVVKGALRFGRLLEIPIDIGGFEARAIIDTGTQATIANPALMAQGIATATQRRFVVVGARGESPATQAALLRDVKLGPLKIASLLAQPGQLPVLRGPDGKELPALFLGMDALGLTRGFAIDFARAELQVRLDPLQLAWARWSERG
ncbi:MAG: aspartyl protease family protein [Pseudomonadota bacterium]